MAEQALGLLRGSAFGSAEAAAYWAYHFARTGYFLGTVSFVCVCVGFSPRVFWLRERRCAR